MIFVKINFFSKISLRNIIRVANSLEPDQAQLLFSLICVQTFWKDYQQTKKVALAGNELHVIRLVSTGRVAL